MKLYRMRFCCTQGQAASGILHPLVPLNQQLFGKETGILLFTQNFIAHPRWGGWSQFTCWGCTVRTAPPTHCYSSVWWSTFSSPHGTSVSFHRVWWAGSPRKVMCCTQEHHTPLSELRYPKYLKTLLNLAGVLAIKAGFHCPQSVLEPIIELNRKASFPSDQLLYRAHFWRPCLIIPTSLSFYKEIVSSWFWLEAKYPPKATLPIQSSSTLSCLAGGLRDPCPACLLEMLGVGSTVPSNHVLTVGRGSGAGPPFSWRGANGQQCFSRGQLFSSPWRCSLAVQCIWGCTQLRWRKRTLLYTKESQIEGWKQSWICLGVKITPGGKVLAGSYYISHKIRGFWGLLCLLLTCQ